MPASISSLFPVAVRQVCHHGSACRFVRSLSASGGSEKQHNTSGSDHTSWPRDAVTLVTWRCERHRKKAQTVPAPGLFTCLLAGCIPSCVAGNLGTLEGTRSHALTFEWLGVLHLRASSVTSKRGPLSLFSLSANTKGRTFSSRSFSPTN